MTTIEARDEYQQQQISEKTAEVSRLQGVVHGMVLERGQLLGDTNLLRGQIADMNVKISELQARCGSCGVRSHE